MGARLSQFLDSEDVTPLRSVTFFVTLRNLACNQLIGSDLHVTILRFNTPHDSLESRLESTFIIDKNRVLKVNNSMLSRCVT